MDTRELDARVAREVMKVDPKKNWVSAAWDTQPPPYSTAMNAAMEVVDYLLTKGWHLKLEHIGYWQASFWQDTDDEEAANSPFYESGQTEVHMADTPALAICLAALEAVAKN